ncbi:type II secretion system F family protein [Sanguibacter hominis]|uniref:type II secretion system F family protein n=1 Tax=Sanguibacter hominis TaxID=1312739 RepID=UPI001B34A3E0|nr:type II secretion system F family protein [Sanguibacter hominis]
MSAVTIDLVLAVVVAAGLLAAVVPWRGLETGRRLPLVAAPGCSDVAGGEPAAEQAEEVDLGVVLELLAVALRAGTSLPRAIRVTGQAVAGADGARLARAGTALELGASWDEAWHGLADTGARARPRLGRRRTADDRVVALVRDCLRPAWVDGAAPGPLLHAAEARLAHDDATAAQVAAERLGVRLVVPLGTCLLPAFILMGLVPVVVALGQGLL